MELYVSTRGCLVVALLMLALTVSPNHGYGSGAPVKVCSSMKPGHGTEQTGGANYVVEVLGGATTYQVGSNIQVRIRGTYKGLLLQARVQGQSTPVGSFMVPAYGTNTKAINCGQPNSAITHSSTTLKDQAVVFTWQPPAGNIGVVEFVATVNQEKRIWWMNLKSTPLSYGGSGTPPAPNTATTAGLSSLLMVFAAFTARLL